MRLFIVCLSLLLVLKETWGFLPTLPGVDHARAPLTVVKSSKWGKAPTPPGKGKASTPFNNKKDDANDWKKARGRSLDYRGMQLEKDERVIVPATEYFAQKNDPIIPVLFASLFIPVFGILGWWLFSPAPEIPEDASPAQTTQSSYDTYFKQTNSGYKARTYKGL